MSEKIPGLRGPHDMVDGLVYFGRLVDKIRLHHAGKLPAEYHNSLGSGFDERCVRFLRISYQGLKDRVIASGDSDEKLLAWALNEGRHPDEEDFEVWNGFMCKRGWKDDVAARLAKRKDDDGFSDRTDIETMFQYIDADEGRL